MDDRVVLIEIWSGIDIGYRLERNLDMKTLFLALLLTASALMGNTAQAIDFGFDGAHPEMEFKAMVNTRGFRTGFLCAELFEGLISGAGQSAPTFDATRIPLQPVGEGIFDMSPIHSWPY